MIRLSLVGSPDLVFSETVLVIHFETPIKLVQLKLCYSNQGFKNQTQSKLHSKMPECKLTGFLRFLRVHVKLASNSKFKIKPAQSGLKLN